MDRPEHYQKLPKGIRCRCLRLWQDADGAYWCCQQPKVKGSKDKCPD